MHMYSPLAGFHPAFTPTCLLGPSPILCRQPKLEPGAEVKASALLHVCDCEHTSNARGCRAGTNTGAVRRVTAARPAPTLTPRTPMHKRTSAVPGEDLHHTQLGIHTRCETGNQVRARSSQQADPSLLIETSCRSTIKATAV